MKSVRKGKALFPAREDFQTLKEPRYTEEYREAKLIPGILETLDKASEFLADKVTALKPEQLAAYVQVAGFRLLAGKHMREIYSQQKPIQAALRRAGRVAAAEALAKRKQGDKRDLGTDYFISTMFEAFAIFKGGDADLRWSSKSGMTQEHLPSDFSRFYEFWWTFLFPDLKLPPLSARERVKKKLNLVNPISKEIKSLRHGPRDQRRGLGKKNPRREEY